MQDRYRHLDENLLQRTAGPYIGSNSEVSAFNRQVGFTPNSGHGLAPRKLTLCATIGHSNDSENPIWFDVFLYLLNGRKRCSLNS